MFYKYPINLIDCLTEKLNEEKDLIIRFIFIIMNDYII
ncbi:hypothetical protein GAPWKB11_0401 [Gilliamella apicola]|nr:hypothetical protein GAPWKB11_0401 [Gilliamella apicola]